MLIDHRTFSSLFVCFCLVVRAEQSSAADTPGSVNPPSADVSRLRPPLPKPPVELFRALLAMTPGELNAWLAKRSPEAQKSILAKIREYAAMNPDQREVRLRVTELRWYLLPLLTAPATNREAQLESVPSELRNLVQDRLAQWDKLSRESQKQVLENESIIRYVFEWAASTSEHRAEAMTNMTPTVRENLVMGFRRWQALLPEQRQAVVNHVREFFDVTPAEQEKILGTLSGPERAQIEKTLQTFEGLSPQQRVQCLRSFQKFASLTPEERRQFLKNAELWKLMTPAERQSWRSLVANLSHQPPLPPGLAFPQPPPLMPVNPGASVNSNSWLTNTN